MAFQTHPGMPQHGLGQQPMGPMHAHSTGPPMGQPAVQGMPPQMHHGMPGPNGPHGNQGGQLMGGLPPGMNPNAHALSHLQPQAQMFTQQQIAQGLPQQQQQQAHQAAQAQQAAIVQHQQTQIAQARQRAFMEQHQRGMHNNMNANTLQGPPPGMTPQQFQNIQQQQQQQRQQLQQYNLPNSLQFQRQQQQQQHLQNAHMMNMQGGGGHGPPQMQPGPHAQPPQMRPQSAMQSMQQQAQGGPLQDHQPQPSGQPNRPQDQTQGPNQAQQGTPQQGRPPIPQQQQPPSNAMQRIPSSQPNQQPQPSQPQPPPQQQQPGTSQGQQTQMPVQQNPNQQQQQQQSVGQEQMRLQQDQLRRNQIAQAQMAQIAQKQAMVQHQQNQIQSQATHGGIVKLMHFADRLSGHNAEADHDQWQRLVSDFFADDAIFRNHLWDVNHTAKEQFDIPQSALARYFGVQFTSGVQNISLSTGGARQKEMAGGVYMVECQRATFTYLFPNNLQVKCEGPLKAILGSQDKFEMLEFDIVTHEEYISSARIRQLFSESPQSLTKSPKMSKTPGKQKAQQKSQQLSRSITLNESDIPNAPVRGDGVTVGVKRFLENVHMFSQMRDLFDFAHQQSQPSATHALHTMVDPSQNGQVAANMNNMNLAMAQNAQLNGIPNANLNAFNQNGNQPAFRNPFVNGAPQMNPQFSSPAHANLGLPNANNSPHMRTGGSPGHPGGIHGVMQPPMAPQMTAQHSTQGTNSSTAPSANASPNVHGKKRRASLAKGDGSLEDHQMNGVGPGDQNKVKPPPKPAGKRQKANG